MPATIHASGQILLERLVFQHHYRYGVSLRTKIIIFLYKPEMDIIFFILTQLFPPLFIYLFVKFNGHLTQDSYSS